MKALEQLSSVIVYPFCRYYSYHVWLISLIVYREVKLILKHRGAALSTLLLLLIFCKSARQLR